MRLRRPLASKARRRGGPSLKQLEDWLLAPLESAFLAAAGAWGGCFLIPSAWCPSRHGIFHAERLRSLADRPARTAAALAERGRARRLLGRPAEARADLVRAVSLAPQDESARAWLWELDWAAGRRRALSAEGALWRAWDAAGALARGRGAQAAAALERARQGFSDSVPAAVLAALAWRRAGDGRAETRALDAALALAPRAPWVLLLRAQRRASAGDDARCLEDVEAALSGAEALDALAIPAGPGPGLARPRALEARMTAALRRRPDAYWALALRGEARRHHSVAQGAAGLRDIERARALAPSKAWLAAVHGRAVAQLDARRGPESLALLDEAARLDPRCGWILVWRAELKGRLGDLAGARRDLDRGLALDPDYDLGYSARGCVLRLLGEPARALADLEKAAALEPGNARPRAERFHALRALGRDAEALEALDEAHRLDSKHRWGGPGAAARLSALARRRPADARAWAWLGEALLRAARPAEALEALRRALELSPRHAWARAWKGAAEALLGRPARARRDLEAAAALDPGYAPAWAWLGRVKQLGGRPREALGDFARALEREPSAAAVIGWSGEAHAALGRGRRAASLARQAAALEGRT